jgi:hypothetical protein
MKKNIILAVFACFFLFIAGLIYLCFRPQTLLLFRWLDLVGFNYSFFRNLGIKPHTFIINNLPNALFLIFGYIFVYIIWNNNRYYLFYVSIITFLNVVYEAATHDIYDIITIFVTFIICLIIYYRYSGVKHET